MMVAMVVNRGGGGGVCGGGDTFAVKIDPLCGLFHSFHWMSASGSPAVNCVSVTCV